MIFLLTLNLYVCFSTFFLIAFMDDYELKRHNYQQHNAEHPLKCKICQRGIKHKSKKQSKCKFN